VHNGRLGAHEVTGRSARVLLEGLSRLLCLRPESKARTRLLFVGPEDRETMEYMSALGLGRQVSCTGLVSYEESLEHVARASVCLLVEGTFGEGVFLPSKLCDYMAARKPVIALGPSVGTAAELASQGGIVRAGLRDAVSTAAVMAELWDAYAGARLDCYKPPEPVVKRFESKRVTEDFLASVRPLVKTRARESCVVA
jgi:glycosyltransferase involved in cell wall biosynthesis